MSTKQLESESSDGEAYAAWLSDQMALPPTLHREHWRKRINPRPVLGGTTLGGLPSPCDAGTRTVPARP